MWKRKEENEPVVNPVKPVHPVAPVNPVKEVNTVSSMPQERRPEVGMGHDAPRGAVAHIGKSVLVDGKLSGSEDLYIDGQVKGTIELRDHNLTVGPNGQVEADVNAKEVILLGTVKGNIRATERVEIRKTGTLVGNLVAARVIIEDGAVFKGSVDIQKADAPKPPESKRPEAPAAPALSDAPRFASVPVEAKKLN